LKFHHPVIKLQGKLFNLNFSCYDSCVSNFLISATFKKGSKNIFSLEVVLKKRDDGLESVNNYLSNNKYHGISATKLSPGVLVNVPTWMQPLVHEHIDAREHDIVVATR